MPVIAKTLLRGARVILVIRVDSDLLNERLLGGEVVLIATEVHPSIVVHCPCVYSVGDTVIFLMHAPWSLLVVERTFTRCLSRDI